MAKRRQILIHRLTDSVPLPQWDERGVGLDLSTRDDIVFELNKMTEVRTGLVIKPPEGFFFTLYLRSSVSRKGIVLLSSQIIDPTYCGPKDEIYFYALLGAQELLSAYSKAGMTFTQAKSSKTMLGQTGEPGLKIWRNPLASIAQFNKGDRIAQLVLTPINKFPIVESTTPPEKISRGGFGSTGK